jgi:hypothetical protein
MWDDKINFARSLKEDIYLKKFVPLIFEDSISTKILKTVNFNKLDLDKISRNYKLHVKIRGLNRNDFYKYILDLNKLTFFNSKVWILKYQKWVIIYFFMYLPTFNDLKNKFKKNLDFNYNCSLNNTNKLYSFYKIINVKLKYSYKFFNSNISKNHF